MAELAVFAAAHAGELLIASAVLQGVGLVSQGIAARNEANFRAQVFARDAELARQASIFEEDRLRERTKRLISSQKAAAGASGSTLEGSSLLVIAETAEDSELDALAIRFSGSVAEASARSSAALSRLEGRAAQTAGFIGAGASLLTGVTRAGVLKRTGTLVP